ncbi:MAG: SH3 domain-containing protein [Mesorhizobium amorphae]|nr:MAG: SH3 domain-containing protein [Mesorhizobium amorphae]
MARNRLPLGWVCAGALVVAWMIGGNDDKPSPSALAISATRPAAPAEQFRKPSEEVPTAPTAASQAAIAEPRETAALAPIALPLPAPDRAAQPARQEVATDPAPIVTQTLYTRARTRVRAEPSTSARVVTTLPAAAAVTTGREERGWLEVQAGGERGWIRADLLDATAPVLEVVEEAPRRPARLLADPELPSRSRSGEPIRDPYVGTCDCPYDRMRNGRACGGRSAYSRPGGRSPQCYF